jgi:hypothetical protein
MLSGAKHLKLLLLSVSAEIIEILPSLRMKLRRGRRFAQDDNFWLACCRYQFLIHCD